MAAPAIERGTIYLGNGFAYRRIEARNIGDMIGRNAQFAQAVELTFIHKGYQKLTKRIVTGGKLVVVAGWGHPVPPGDLSDGTPLGPIETAWGEVRATCTTPAFLSATLAGSPSLTHSS